MSRFIFAYVTPRDNKRKLLNGMYEISGERLASIPLIKLVSLFRNFFYPSLPATYHMPLLQLGLTHWKF